MEKTIFRRITAFTAALTVTAGATASCGAQRDKNGKSKDAQQLMAASYRAVEMDADVENISYMYRIDDNTIFMYGHDPKDYTPIFYKTDNEFTDIQKIDVDLGINTEKVDVNLNAVPSASGDIFAYATFTDYGNMKKPNFNDPNFDYENFDWEKYEKDMEENVKTSSKIYVIDLDGKIKSEKDLKGLTEDEEENQSGIGRLVSVGNDKFIATIYGMDEEEYAVINSEGNVVEKMDFSDADWVNGIYAIDEKQFAVCEQSKNDMKVVFYDAETLKPTGEEIKNEKLSDVLYGELFAGTGDFKLFSMNSTGLYGIKSDGTSDEIINWLDSDLGNGNVSSLINMDNGDYVVLYNDYSSSKYTSSLYRLTARDASEIENMQVLTIGSLNGDWELREQVSEFNKTHDGVRFKIIDYSQYDDYDEDKEMYINGGAAQLKKDIISNNAPDMILTSGDSMIKSLGKKKLFVDLYELLENDPDLSKEDIMPNILKAGESDGKLLSLSPAFTIETLAAKKKFIDKSPLTASELIDIYENRPKKEMHLYSNDTRDSAMELLYYSMGELIDYENGTCKFDDPEFKKLLNFIGTFEEGKDFDSYDDPGAEEYYNEMRAYYGTTAVRNDKTLLANINIYDAQEFVSTLNGDFKTADMNFVGFPTNKGNGAVMSVYSTYAILTTCENKEACWELIKSNFEEESDDDENYKMRGYGMSALKKNFDRELEKCMSKPYYIDENGKKVEYDYVDYNSDDDKQTVIDPLTKEQVDYIAEYIESTEMVMSDFDPDVETILMEEMMAFVHGEKTADETADILQNRISLILSEQS